jgi:hypothetical protein
MSKITLLGRAHINTSDEISIELVTPADLPAAVRIVWPAKPTVTGARNFPDTAAAAVKLFAEAGQHWPQSGGGGNCKEQ